MRNITDISTNVHSKWFRNPTGIDANCDLELLKEEKLIKVLEDNDSTITFNINWQKIRNKLIA
ncbi:hypothetical protein [Erysipelothrix amsterdamensis]|uniref:hypothetical protein n=1 Tax=Erysipelothrix amsterdamensis TaxID=2929157 RepID=UPI0020A7B709